MSGSPDASQSDDAAFGSLPDPLPKRPKGSNLAMQAKPPGYVELPEQTRKLVEYLGFDPLFEMACLYRETPKELWSLRSDILAKLNDRVHARKTDHGLEGLVLVPVQIFLPERLPPKALQHRPAPDDATTVLTEDVTDVVS